MARRTIVKDRGWIAVKMRVRELNNQGVKVGLRAGAASGEVIEYAIYNEFGTSRIPARPFMRHTVDTAEAATRKLMRNWAGMLVARTLTVSGVLGNLGAYFQMRIQATIRNSKRWAVPNAPSTVSRKGGSTPLVEHGVLINSIDWVRTRL